MALVLDDRVKETSTTTGTGTLNLSGAVSGFQTFVAGVGNGNTTYYAIVNRDEAEWETGIGTVTDASTTAYSSSNEVSASGTYTAGGGSLTSVTPTTSGTTAICDFADISFTSATITARAALIYNSSNSNKAVCVLDFGGDKTSTSGTFTIQFPAADASNAILRLA